MQTAVYLSRIGIFFAAFCLACTSPPDGPTPGSESTSPSIQTKEEHPTDDADVRQLMNYSFRLARQLLVEYGSFHPFAFVMKKDGQIGQVALSQGHDHEGTVLLATLREMIETRAAEGHYRAVAITADVHIEHSDEQTDAIEVGLEHIGGYCVNVYLPYERSDTGEVTVGEAVSAGREGTVFGPCRETAGD